MTVRIGYRAGEVCHEIAKAEPNEVGLLWKGGATQGVVFCIHAEINDPQLASTSVPRLEIRL